MVNITSENKTTFKYAVHGVSITNIYYIIIIILDKERTMDNVQNYNNYINIPSSHTYRSYKQKLYSNKINDRICI
jgi:hypothetical protein